MKNMAFPVFYITTIKLILSYGPFLALGQTSILSNFDSTTQVYCPNTTIHDADYGTFEFPSTVALLRGNSSTAKCNFGETDNGAVNFLSSNKGMGSFAGAINYCYLDLEKGEGVWSNYTVKLCRERNLAMMEKNVRDIVQRTPEFNEYNIRTFLPLLIGLISNSRKDYQSAQTLVLTIDKLLGAVETYEEGGFDDIRELAFYYLDQYLKTVLLDEGEKVSVNSTDITVESAVFPDTDFDGDFVYSFKSFNISSPAIQMALNQTNKPTRLKITSFSNKLFFHWGDQRDWDNGTELGLNGTDLAFNNNDWRIFRVEFENAVISNLSMPISYTIPVNDSSEFRWVCAYWNQKGKKWSIDGMKTVRLENAVKCESTHLTAFSVLLDPIPKGDLTLTPKQEMHERILSILSTIGSVLSLSGLGLTVLTYGVFRKLRRERSNRILLNLSIALFFLHLMSLSTEESLWADFCFLPALVLHYILLATLSWMLVDGIFMYRILISVFVKPENQFLLKRSIFAWGIPLIPVILTATIDGEMYAAGRDGICIIAGHLNFGLYYAFYLGPVVVILLINSFVFARIILVLFQQSSRRKTERNKQVEKELRTTMLSPVQIKGAITLFLLLGVGWILGLLAIGPFEYAFRYANTLLNAGQGLFIFLFRVLLDSNASRAWRKTVMREEETSFSGSSLTRGTGNTNNKSENHNNNNNNHNNNRTSFSSSPIYISSAENSMTKTDPFANKLATSLMELLNNNPTTSIK